MQDQRWYVARLKPGRERVAISGLSDQGFENYYPKMTVTRARQGRVFDATEPVFHSYLFLKSQEDAGCWRSINNTRGVVRLLGNDRPCPVSDREVDSLRDREAKGQLRHGGKRQIRQGDTVEFKFGSFTGLQGICEWTKRERIGVLLSFLGGDTVATTKRDTLRLVVN